MHRFGYALCTVALAWVFRDWLSAKSGPGEQWSALLHGDLGTKIISSPWPHSESAVLALLREHQPRVLRNAPSDMWVATQRWTPEYIHDHVLHLERVQVSKDHPLYEYHNAAPLGPFISTSAGELSSSTAVSEPRLRLRPGSFQKVDMSTSDFFDIALRQISEPVPPFVYYAGNFGGNHPILADVGSPKDFFMDRVAQEAGSGKPPVYYVWMGNKGVIAHAHFDNVYNFYIHIYGRKRFVLFPPILFDALKLYPKLHSRNGQSQINFTAPQTELFPEFLTEETQQLMRQHVRVADLDPGDVLVLPPYWLHYVTALDTSISVSLWAYAEAVAVYANVTAVTIPMHREWGESERVAALGFYMMSLFGKLAPSYLQSNVSGTDDVTRPERVLAQKRFQMLFQDRYRTLHHVSAFNHAPYNRTACTVSNSVAELTALQNVAADVAAKLNTLPPFAPICPRVIRVRLH